MTTASALTRRRAPSERLLEAGLFLAAAVGVLTTIGILIVLVVETVDFFRFVSPVDFFLGTQWSASIAPYRFGVLALVSGTLLVASIAVVIAVPLGLLSAVLLAEYASPRVRNLVKPLLETIAGIPTIVLGFFGLYFLTPNILQPLIGKDNIGTFNALSGGIVVGLLITPVIASISEDSMRAVPRGLREAAFAMGATRFEVVRKVVVPAALSGIMASDHPGHLARRRRDDGRGPRRRHAAATYVRPVRERADDDGVHHPDQPRRHAPGIHPVQGALRGGGHAVRSDAHPEPDQQSRRRTLPDGLLT